MMRKSKLLSVGGVLAIVAAGIVVAAGTASARTQVHAAAYRLTATLTPGQEVPAVQAPTAAIGHFHGVLFMSGIGAARVGALAGCKVVVAPKRSGLPTKLSCGGTIITLPAVPGQWRLFWQLSYSGLSGPATGADIHVAPAGHTAPPMFALCRPCSSTSHGLLSVSGTQASALMSSTAYANVDTAKNPSGEIRGQITRTLFGIALGG
jgi:hypothetical protein